jgi:hypothetical protein
LIEAAKRGFDFFIGSELAAVCLSKALEDSGQMSGIDGLRLSLVSGQAQHGPCNFVLAAGRQTPHGF